MRKSNTAINASTLSTLALAIFLTLTIMLMATSITEAAGDTPAPVSDLLVHLTHTKPIFNTATNTYDSKATLTVTGVPFPPIQSPVFVVITAISLPGVQVANADGMMAPEMPYVIVKPSGLPRPPRTISLVIKFHDVSNRPFDFAAQVWAGPIRNPQITSTPGTTAQVTVPYSYQVAASDPQSNPLTYSLSGALMGMTMSATGLVNWVPMSTGMFPVKIAVNNGRGGNATQSYSISVTPLTVPNVVGLGQPEAAKSLRAASLKVGTVTYQTSGTIPGGQVTSQAPTAGASVSAGTAVNLVVSLPPDPETIAPPINQSVSTIVGNTTSFLYAGANPIIQTSVAPNIISPTQGAVIRGRVLDKGSNPQPGVIVSILNHPEFGQTVSRADGMFDMAVNGGGQFTLNYARPDLLTVQRQLIVPWQRYVVAPDVILLVPDSGVTLIDLTSTAPIQVARGSVITDSKGRRQATLLFPRGTTATMTIPGQPSIPLTTLHVHATEFTVGPTGPQSMPAGLPPASGYTYAVELSADEAISAGATSVQFSRHTIPLYVDNFHNIPVGTAVPRGSYDKGAGVWSAGNDGLVVKIVGVTANGLADLAIDPSGNPASPSALAALGIADAERQVLVGLYSQGQTLWRVALDHFSPEDLNFGLLPPLDAVAYSGPGPKGPDGLDDPTTCSGGSVIEVENQTVGESIPIAGTLFALNYRSNKAPGRKDAYKLTVPLSGASVPASLGMILLDVFVAGQHYQQCFQNPNIIGSPSCATPPDLTNLTGHFVWDGNDGYHRKVQGVQPVVVRIGYTYPGHYGATGGGGSGFGSGAGGGGVVEPSPVDVTVNLFTNFETSLGTWDERPTGLGGWSLSVHHNYDASGKALYLGDGSRRSIASKVLSATISTFAGTGQHGFSGDNGPATAAELWFGNYSGLAASPDGAIYIADAGNFAIRRVGVDGIIATIAGTLGQPGHSGFRGPANQAKLSNPSGLALGPDGSLYIADSGNNVILRVTTDQNISVFAGSPGVSGDAGDDGPALSAHLNSPGSLAFGPDGSLFVLDSGADRVRRIGSNGVIYAFAGTGMRGPAPFSGGIPATQATLDVRPDSGLAAAPDGSVYIADSDSFQVRRVGPDGVISRFAGAATEGGFGFPSGDGGPAILANTGYPTALAIGADGSLYIGDISTAGGTLDLVRRVGPEGVITTVAGGGAGPLGDGGPATSGSLFDPIGLAVGPDGSLYIADGLAERIRKVTSLPGLQLSEFLIASENGREVYKFDGTGRHELTLDALTGATLYAFTYDPDGSGRLKTVTDVDHNQTMINYDPTSGKPLSIVGPFGQTTTLGVDANGYLNQVTDPGGNTFSMIYSPEGLLQTFTDPNGNAASQKYSSSMVYDPASGRLKTDTDNAQASTMLGRTDNGVGSFTVSVNDPLGRQATYLSESQPTGKERRLTTLPDTTQTELLIGTDGSRKTTVSDGTIVDLVQGPDPRFSMQAPVPQSLTLTRGVTGVITTQRQANWDPVNPSNNSLTDKVTLNSQPPLVRSFDGPSRTITNTSAEGRTSTTVLDSQGRVAQVQVSGLASSFTVVRQPNGQLHSISAATSVPMSSEPARTTVFSYGNDGFLSTITDPLKNPWGFTFDSAGRLAQRTLPDGSLITYGRDANGNVTSVTPPGRPAHGFTYTPDNLISVYTPPVVPGTGPTQYDYYPDRRLKQVTRPDKKTVSFTYEPITGRLHTMTIGRGSYVFGYDTTNSATGHLLNIATPNNELLTYGYQGPLLQSVAWSGTVTGSVARTLDTNFRTASLSINGSSPVSFMYDNDGLFKRAGDLVISRNLPKNPFITGVTLGNIIEAITPNDFGEIAATNVACTGPGCTNSNLLSENYTYDQMGRVSHRTETILGGTPTTFEYHYDINDQLHEVVQNGTTTAVYTPDSNGNRQKVTRNGIDTIGVYDDQDRLTQYGAAMYTYTPNGELLTKADSAGTTTFNYDELGNLVTVRKPDGTLIEYVVDGRNRRAGKKRGGNLIQGFLYQDLLRPIAEVDGNSNVVSRFVYGSRFNVPDYMIKNSRIYRIVVDQLGSVRLVVDVATGAVAQRIDYDEFGQVLQDTNPAFQPFGFAGGLYDGDTGLVRFGERDYDSSVGRWTTKDPVGFPAGVNLYAYVAGDPINAVDPLGLSFESNLANFAVSFAAAGVTSVYISGVIAAGVTAGVPVLVFAGGAFVVAGLVSTAVGIYEVATAKDIISGAALTDEARIDLASSVAGGLVGGVLAGYGWGARAGVRR